MNEKIGRILRVIYMGTPRFAVPSLAALSQTEDLVRVVTRPDRPAGRGRKKIPSPVKEEALDRGIPALQPMKITEPEFVRALRDFSCDLFVVAAFGQILPPEILEIPKYGCINIHASLLPKYRGASPIAAAIAAGENKTGITIIRMDAGMDTGDILMQRELEIGPEETTGVLTERLAILGARTLLQTLKILKEGRLERIPQDGAGAIATPLLKKEHGVINWNLAGEAIRNHVRAMDPWPGAYTLVDGEILKIWRVTVREEKGRPGEVIRAGRCFQVGTRDGSVVIETVQRPGRRRINGAEFLRGRPAIREGMILGSGQPS
ncbi:MAG: methionyl-tRNA formyltransferase [Deltaproteobacteria bacterium]|nr:methionyl-tRNA formyltransferase [Deltaproteobacteria bacterium]